VDNLLCNVVQIYVIVIFARIILSWIPVSGDGVMASISSVIYSLTEPILGPMRRAIPPVRLGMAAIDVSSLILLLGIQLIVLPLVCD
jgi:YggT family protein